MFKKLFLVLALAAMLAMSTFAFSAEVGQKCNIPVGAHVVVFTQQQLIPLTMDIPANVEVLSAIPDNMVNFLNEKTAELGMDWTGGSVVKFTFDGGDGSGPQDYILIVMSKDLNCE